MKRREKETNIPWKYASKRKSRTSHPKSKKSQTTNKTQMRTKNNTNEQIIPTHNRDNENCNITDKKEYEVLPHKLLLLPRNLKDPLICLEMLAKEAEIT